VTRLRAVLSEATGLVDGVNPTVPSLMTAVVETESAFSGSDANGHFVRIQSIVGACTAGLNAGCAATSDSHSAGPVPTTPPAPAPPGSHTSDQDLLRLFLGSSG
jgi:hypothetical protein